MTDFQPQCFFSSQTLPKTHWTRELSAFVKLLRPKLELRQQSYQYSELVIKPPSFLPAVFKPLPYWHAMSFSIYHQTSPSVTSMSKCPQAVTKPGSHQSSLKNITNSVRQSMQWSVSCPIKTIWTKCLFHGSRVKWTRDIVGGGQSSTFLSPLSIGFGIVDSAIYSFLILESKHLQSLLDLQKPCEPRRIWSDLNGVLPLSLIFRKFRPLHAAVQDL